MPLLSTPQPNYLQINTCSLNADDPLSRSASFGLFPGNSDGLGLVLGLNLYKGLILVRDHLNPLLWP
jgi:hypothetical protein